MNKSKNQLICKNYSLERMTGIEPEDTTINPELFGGY